MESIAHWRSKSGKWYIVLWKLEEPNQYKYVANKSSMTFTANTDAEAIADIETNHVATKRHQPGNPKMPMKRVE